MAGRGSRFAKAGYTTPKPLIEVHGQPMFIKSLSSLNPLDAPMRYTVILRQEHVNTYGLDKLVKAQLPELNIVITDEEPTGAAVDAYRAKPHLRPDEAVIVTDCDIFYGGNEYYDLIKRSLRNEISIDGAILTFNSQDPRFSYVETDESGRAKRTAEKVVISNHAIGGAYYFAHTQTFIDACEQLFEQPLGEGRPEYFISYLYNELIKQGKDVRAVDGDFTSFGTPEELQQFLKSQPS
jgi:NDP-sugar pyrophosphorylase family protein